MAVYTLLLLVTVLGIAASSSCAFNKTWQTGAHATFYGDVNGDGTDGEACGYQILAGTPYGKSIAAGSTAIYLDGDGCGACYEVKCTHKLCKSESIRVLITDQCLGAPYCDGNKMHFDLSGEAYSSMAVPGEESSLRSVGVLDVSYERVACDYSGTNVSFHVDSGSNSYWLSLIVKYQAGAGDLQAVEIKQHGSSKWESMTHNWGASYFYQAGSTAVKGPSSIRLTAKLDGRVLVAEKAIPDNFTPGVTYESKVQF